MNASEVSIQPQDQNGIDTIGRLKAPIAPVALTYAIGNTNIQPTLAAGVAMLIEVKPGKKINFKRQDLPSSPATPEPEQKSTYANIREMTQNAYSTLRTSRYSRVSTTVSHGGQKPVQPHESDDDGSSDEELSKANQSARMSAKRRPINSSISLSDDDTSSDDETQKTKATTECTENERDRKLKSPVRDLNRLNGWTAGKKRDDRVKALSVVNTQMRNKYRTPAKVAKKMGSLIDDPIFSPRSSTRTISATPIDSSEGIQNKNKASSFSFEDTVNSGENQISCSFEATEREFDLKASSDSQPICSMDLYDNELEQLGKEAPAVVEQSKVEEDKKAALIKFIKRAKVLPSILYGVPIQVGLAKFLNLIADVGVLPKSVFKMPHGSGVKNTLPLPENALACCFHRKQPVPLDVLATDSDYEAALKKWQQFLPESSDPKAAWKQLWDKILADNSHVKQLQEDIEENLESTLRQYIENDLWRKDLWKNFSTELTNIRGDSAALERLKKLYPSLDPIDKKQLGDAWNLQLLKAQRINNLEIVKALDNCIIPNPDNVKKLITLTSYSIFFNDEECRKSFTDIESYSKNVLEKPEEYKNALKKCRDKLMEMCKSIDKKIALLKEIEEVGTVGILQTYGWRSDYLKIKEKEKQQKALEKLEHEIASYSIDETMRKKIEKALDDEVKRRNKLAHIFEGTAKIAMAAPRTLGESEDIFNGLSAEADTITEKYNNELETVKSYIAQFSTFKNHLENLKGLTTFKELRDEAKEEKGITDEDNTTGTIIHDEMRNRVVLELTAAGDIAPSNSKEMTESIQKMSDQDLVRFLNEKRLSRIRNALGKSGHDMPLDIIQKTAEEIEKEIKTLKGRIDDLIEIPIKWLNEAIQANSKIVFERYPSKKKGTKNQVKYSIADTQTHLNNKQRELKENIKGAAIPSALARLRSEVTRKCIDPKKEDIIKMIIAMGITVIYSEKTKVPPEDIIANKKEKLKKDIEELNINKELMKPINIIRKKALNKLSGQQFDIRRLTNPQLDSIQLQADMASYEDDLLSVEESSDKQSEERVKDLDQLYALKYPQAKQIYDKVKTKCQQDAKISEEAREKLVELAYDHFDKTLKDYQRHCTQRFLRTQAVQRQFAGNVQAMLHILEEELKDKAAFQKLQAKAIDAINSSIISTLDDDDDTYRTLQSRESEEEKEKCSAIHAQFVNDMQKVFSTEALGESELKFTTLEGAHIMPYPHMFDADTKVLCDKLGLSSFFTIITHCRSVFQFIDDDDFKTHLKYLYDLFYFNPDIYLYFATIAIFDKAGQQASATNHAPKFINHMDTFHESDLAQFIQPVAAQNTSGHETKEKAENDQKEARQKIDGINYKSLIARRIIKHLEAIKEGDVKSARSDSSNLESQRVDSQRVDSQRVDSMYATLQPYYAAIKRSASSYLGTDGEKAITFSSANRQKNILQLLKSHAMLSSYLALRINDRLYNENIYAQEQAYIEKRRSGGQVVKNTGTEMDTISMPAEWVSIKKELDAFDAFRKKLAKQQSS